MGMRVVPLSEKKKRGCKYCKDMKLTRDSTGIRTGCPHYECPYHSLDSHDTYEEFMASDDAKILVDGFFQTTASCYELSNANATVRKVFSGKENSGF